MTLFTLGSIFAVSALAMSLLYTTAYGFTSAWWSTGFGRSHFLLLLNITLIFGLILLSIIFGPHAFFGSDVLRVVIYGSITGTLTGSLIQYIGLWWRSRDE